jgi:hypothetical protein
MEMVRRPEAIGHRGGSEDRVGQALLIAHKRRCSMVRLISALILVLLIATPTLGQQSLVGTYKLVSNAIEVDGVSSATMGKAHGYFVLTPTHAIQFFTADNRKFGTSADEKAALFNTMVAWSGVYRVEGDKIICIIDASWTENLNGKTVAETWQLSGNRLTIRSSPSP